MMWRWVGTVVVTVAVSVGVFGCILEPVGPGRGYRGDRGQVIYYDARDGREYDRRYGGGYDHQRSYYDR